MHHLVIGASSAIATALINQLLARGDSVVAVSRAPQAQLNAYAPSTKSRQLQWINSDYSESSIEKICAQQMADKHQIKNVFICNGILHNQELSPEKRLEDICESKLMQIMSINAFIPLLWVKHLKPVLKGVSGCTITTFSARIGSIGDNNMGGWYAYRASKAALNMLLKSASIEYQREKRDVHFVMFHPGTTDTPLSKPFQKSVKPDKLFTPQFVAEQLLYIINTVPRNTTISYLDWQNKPIEW